MDDLIGQFDEATLPKERWTHREHLLVAAHAVRTYGKDGALDYLRTGIRRLNAAQGLVETPTRGYHETITRFWVSVVAAFLADHDGSPGQQDRALVETYGNRRDLYAEYWSWDVFGSPEARHGWRAPDLQPLPGGGPA